MKTMNDYATLYKKELAKGDIQKAYKALTKYVLSLKAYFTKSFSNDYSVGNASHGYLDYSYFYFSNEFLRERKLRFGIVLNHEKMRFELWLMGQSADIQSIYWDLLKSTKWNKLQKEKPKYSVIEVVLVEKPDFDDLNLLTQQIEEKVTYYLEEIMSYLKINSIE